MPDRPAMQVAAAHGDVYFPPGVAVPADAGTNGLWSRVYAWPLIAIHAVLLPDGRLLTYGTDQAGIATGRTIYDVWDGQGAPDAGHLTLPNGTGIDTFCSAQLLLPWATPGVVVAGGDIWTGTSVSNTGNPNSAYFDARANTLTRGADMNRARWYATLTTLLDGQTYVQGGNGGADHPELRDRNGSFRRLERIDTSALGTLYPRNWVAPSGQVFGFDSAGAMYSVDPGGSGGLQRLGQFSLRNAGVDSSAAMFQPGRILQFGGNSNGALIIDIRDEPPVVKATDSMSSQRRLVTATLLPDGRVLATGGSEVWNELVGVNNSAEIWDPRTGRWTRGASGALARLYHSNAVLLPDASVLVMGGGAPGPLTNTNVEIYYPPYLFTADGRRAARPRISQAPEVVDIGQTFRLGIDSATRISRVTLVGTAASTHGWNMSQRFVDLAFERTADGLVVQAPREAADAPPGYYHVFAIDSAGVPSVSRIVRVPVADTPSPRTTPRLTRPADPVTKIGSTVRLELSARDPNGDPLRYAAHGLPPGLKLDAATGVIGGKPTQVGHYAVTLTASDGINADSETIEWTVYAGDGPLRVDEPSTRGTVQVGRDARFDVEAHGSGLRYRWDFGDGTRSDWSADPRAQHAYARPGSYLATVTVADRYGDTQRRTAVQTVYLAPTRHAPTQSGNLLVTEPRQGAPRLWVVNQDNDSVSVFDTRSRRKLAELRVGAAPRAIAQARDGTVYVSNYRAASLSVIDAEALDVTGSVEFERGDAPYGLAAAPTSDELYVVLEGRGELRKLRLADRKTVARADLGAHARHVSVTGDGARVYVARYVTPPMPGEATRKVDLGGDVGGEVLSFATATLKRERTIRLTASTEPDAENQGRGVPNYLGAVAISPDGTQAWVPSKLDNIQRGALRDGRGLNFQNTVRAVASRLDLKRNAHDAKRRVDLDNAGVASAALFDRHGNLLFVALETSREVAVLDAWSGRELMRIDVGRAPQGLALAPDQATLYVNNFMDRSVGVYDLRPLLDEGRLAVPRIARLDAVEDEKLKPQVLAGKRLFYDAKDPRLARDRYLSCASCHNDGTHDGRVWDMTGFGEGLRNTISLRGHARQGLLHWSGNFDEVQDFEGQIRALAGGSGLMTDAAFAAHRNPLGTPKAGLSDDLDALAAYVESLRTNDASPARPSASRLSKAAEAGRLLFNRVGCAVCHAGSEFTGSGWLPPADVGTLKRASGERLGAKLTGIDVPTLRGVWATAPYLHDGSAPTLQAAIRAHSMFGGLSRADRDKLAAFLREVDDRPESADQ